MVIMPTPVCIFYRMFFFFFNINNMFVAIYRFILYHFESRLFRMNSSENKGLKASFEWPNNITGAPLSPLKQPKSTHPPQTCINIHDGLGTLCLASLGSCRRVHIVNTLSTRNLSPCLSVAWAEPICHPRATDEKPWSFYFFYFTSSQNSLRESFEHRGQI